MHENSAAALCDRGSTNIERIFAWTIFPAVLAAAIGVTIWFIEAGVEPALAIAPGVIGAYTLVAVLERVFPYQASWLHSRGDLPVDTAYLFTNGLVTRLLEPAVLAGSVVLAAWLSRRWGGRLWPEDWPLLAQLSMALVIAELVEYWVHRSMHERDWLWRFHATHHSAPRLYWLNAVRFHPVDLSLVGVGKLIPLAMLGAGAPVIALVTIFSAVHGIFQHANLQLRLGPLNWIFSMAELHRWHHSRNVKEANTNYGGNLILWDIVFGTRYLPADREPPADIGIAGMPNFPMAFLPQLVSPFRWRKVRECAAAMIAEPSPWQPVEKRG